jgi:hypothetical protein
MKVFLTGCIGGPAAVDPVARGPGPPLIDKIERGGYAAMR